MVHHHNIERAIWNAEYGLLGVIRRKEWKTGQLQGIKYHVGKPGVRV
jgi:hypothetical protein